MQNGDAPLGELYYEYGRRIHHDKDRDFGIADALTAVGLDPELPRRPPTTRRGTPESAPDGCRSRTDRPRRRHADHRLQRDRKGVKQAYFGPVISAVPPTEDSSPCGMRSSP
ncbi:MAG: hypothetical protein R2710_01080 [Acidimicrobiales bacterium]